MSKAKRLKDTEELLDLAIQDLRNSNSQSDMKTDLLNEIESLLQGNTDPMVVLQICRNGKEKIQLYSIMHNEQIVKKSVKWIPKSEDEYAEIIDQLEEHGYTSYSGGEYDYYTDWCIITINEPYLDMQYDTLHYNNMIWD